MADYGTVAGFRAYHTARGRDTSAYDDDEVEAAKLIATEWLDGMYRASFPGFKVDGRDQVREWPRYDAFDREGDYIPSTTVPTEVDNATYEATLRELTTTGALLADFTPSKYDRISIDGAVSINYRNQTALDVQTQFPVINQILAPLIGGSDSSALSGSISRV